MTRATWSYTDPHTHVVIHARGPHRTDAAIQIRRYLHLALGRSYWKLPTVWEVKGRLVRDVREAA